MKNLNDKLSSIIYSETLLCNILGQKSTLYILIDNSYKTEIRFMNSGKFYSFFINNWTSKYINDFLEKFHLYKERNKSEYGTYTINEQTGKIILHQEDSILPISDEQKINCIIHACKDIFRCLNKLAEFHYHSLLEYAVIYNDKLIQKSFSLLEKKSYSKYITNICCSCIINTNFVCPNVDFQVVEFK